MHEFPSNLQEGIRFYRIYHSSSNINYSCDEERNEESFVFIIASNDKKNYPVTAFILGGIKPKSTPSYSIKLEFIFARNFINEEYIILSIQFFFTNYTVCLKSMQNVCKNLRF